MTASTIASEIQSLSPSAMIELFVLDLSRFPGAQNLYFTSGVSQVGGNPVVWQGQSYFPLPIEASGFQMTTKGVMPQPKLVVANAGGLISAELTAFDDLIGCKVTRKRTHARFLDAVNFPNGNPFADPNQAYPDDIWYIEQKATENKYAIEFKLSSAFDLLGVKLPYRQVIQNSCAWVYRGPECSYTGAAMFDVSDRPTADPTKDVCSKRLTGCRCRYGNGVLPFGGFPGATRYD